MDTPRPPADEPPESPTDHGRAGAAAMPAQATGPWGGADTWWQGDGPTADEPGDDGDGAPTTRPGQPPAPGEPLGAAQPLDAEPLDVAEPLDAVEPLPRRRTRPRWLTRREPVREPAQEATGGLLTIVAPAPAPAPALAPRAAGGPVRLPRSAAAGLAALVPLALLAAFFGWVGGGAFVLAAGGGATGTATVTHCAGRNLGQRCVAQFTAADEAFAVEKVALLGVSRERQPPGTAVPARMVDADGRLAYVADGAALHLRWLLGLLAALGCGAAIARATGTRLLPQPRRRTATLACLLSPVALMAAFVVHHW